MSLVVSGTFIHAPERNRLETFEDALMVVDENGVIREILEHTDPQYTAVKSAAKSDRSLVQLGSGWVVLPGMVDLHIHAPQWPQLGRALHLPLEEWLMEFTFPLEAKYSDTNFARSVYQSLVSTLLANGTTTAVYFSSIHLEASQILAAECLSAGQRSFVGKVVMDEHTQCPDYYRDTSAYSALDDTKTFIDFVQQMPGNSSGLVQPIITPRFVPSCTDDALRGLGAMARDTECRVQTHCSESDWEHAYVLQRFGKTDTEVLNSFGLLQPGSVLAHCNFISRNDMQIMNDTGTGIAHCPLSNSYFANSVFPLRQALDKGVKVGLGTDISGGPSPSLFYNAASAITSSRMLEDGVDPAVTRSNRGRGNARINFIEAYWMATAGGGDALEIPVGRFAPGYRFDALAVDIDASDSNIIDAGQTSSPDDLLQSIIYNVTRDNIRAVWVDGVVTHGATGDYVH